MRHILAADIQRKSVAAAAKDVLTHLHADSREYVVHLDTDLISNAEFPAVNVPAEGGMPLADVRAALTEAAGSTYLIGLTITQYNPDKDPDGSAAKKLVDLLVESLSVRLAEQIAAAPATAETIPTPPLVSDASSGESE